MLPLIPATPLAVHISKVLRLCSQKQMVGVNAARVIAAMTDVHPIGDAATVDHPRNAMGQMPLALIREPRIAVSHESDRAFPTSSIGFRGEFGQPVLYRPVPVKPLTGCRAIDADAFIDSRRVRGKRHSAGAAYARWRSLIAHRLVLSTGAEPGASRALPGISLEEF